MDLLKLVGLKASSTIIHASFQVACASASISPAPLAIDPEILLMERAVLGARCADREIMQTELLRIWDEGRKTVLFVTHQIDEAVFLSDRVLVFARRPGRLQAEIKISLPRPRSLPVKRPANSSGLVDRIWRMIEDDVRAAALYENA